MKTFLFLSLLLFTTTLHAQTWKKVKHNNHICYMLTPASQYPVLAAKSTDSGGYETVNVKFKIPYRWANTGTANVKITQIDLSTGKRYSSDSFADYRNGWVYVGHYSYNSRPAYSYIITVYKNNDSGRIRGESKTFNLHLETLDLSGLPFSNNLEKLW